jgi:hypothetical protein
MPQPSLVANTLDSLGFLLEISGLIDRNGSLENNFSLMRGRPPLHFVASRYAARSEDQGGHASID